MAGLPESKFSMPASASVTEVFRRVVLEDVALARPADT